MENELTIEKYKTLPLNLQKQVLDYIDFLSTKYITKQKDETQQTSEEDISPELKKILKSRIKEHKQNPQNAVTWEEIEEKFEKKYGYEI
jgi:Putative addiction module component